jgi:hypothetical protein
LSIIDAVEPMRLGGTEVTTLGEWRLPIVKRCLMMAGAISFASCLAALMITGLLLAVHDESVGSLVLAIIAGPSAYGLIKAAINIWRVRVAVTSAGAVVAGVTRTHRIPLQQIERFEPRVVNTGIGANGIPMVVLVLRAGDPVGIYALSREGFVWNSRSSLGRLAVQARALNSILARAQEVA